MLKLAVRIALCLTCVLLSQCKSYYYFRESATVQMSAPALDRNRVALVGFRSYRTKWILRRGWESHFHESTELRDRLPFGTPVSQLRSNGINSEVSEATIRAFRKQYEAMARAGRAGGEEVSYLFEQVEDRIVLRKFDVDFIVVGVHGPPIHRNPVRVDGFADWFLDQLLYAVQLVPVGATLGTIPMMRRYITETTVFVYDANLNLKATYNYENVLWHRMAWWGEDRPASQSIGVGQGSELASYPPETFRADVDDFSRDFARDYLGAEAAAGE